MNYLDVFARQNWETRMLAHQYADREKVPMHTTTEEREFSAQTSMSDISAAAGAAITQLQTKAGKNGYTHEIVETFKMEVTHGSSVVGGWIVKTSATYAKIVPLEDANEPNEGDMDGEREARGPEEKDYTDLIEAPPIDELSEMS